MSLDDKIIEAKSNEIRRLHNVCRTKDVALKNAIEMIEKLSESTTNELRNDALASIHNLREYLG